MTRHLFVIDSISQLCHKQMVKTLLIFEYICLYAFERQENINIVLYIRFGLLIRKSGVLLCERAVVQRNSLHSFTSRSHRINRHLRSFTFHAVCGSMLIR